MSDIKALFEEMRTTWEEWKAADQRREEELKRYGQELGETKQLLERIEKRLTELETAHQRARIAGKASAEQEFSFAKALRGLAFGNWQGAEFEQKVLLATGSPSAGGYLIPPEYAEGVLEFVRARTVFNRLNVTRFTAQSAPFRILKQSGGATAYMIGENADITKSSPSFDQLEINPRKAAALVAISNDLIRRADPAVEQIVRRDIGQALATLLDKQMLDGDGTGNNLLGVFNTPGVNTLSLGANGGTPSVDTLYDALYEVEKYNGQITAWVFHPRTKNTLRKLKNAEGTYLLQPPVSASEPPTLLGLPYYETTAIPINLTVGTSTDCSYILAGDWREAVVVEWLGLQLDASREASYVEGGTLVSAFSRDLTVVRAIQEIGFALRRPEWFVKVVGVRP